MRSIRSPWRFVAAGFLLLNAAVHVPLVPEHLQEAPYVGVLFIALSAVCVLLAGVIVLADTREVWLTSGVVSLVALAAFLASRTVGLPQIGDDIGNWSEPLGFPTLVAEVVTIGLSLVALHQVSRAGTVFGQQSGRQAGQHDRVDQVPGTDQHQDLHLYLGLSPSRCPALGGSDR